MTNANPFSQKLLTWNDLVGLKVGVWGMGVEGKATAARLSQLGVATVVVDESLAETTGDPKLSFSKGGGERLARCDVVIKSPGISPYGDEAHTLSGVRLVGAIGLWMATAQTDRVVVVTGTKGKSTTSALVAEILRALGNRVFLGGNIGVVPHGVDVGDDYDYWVLETSSYQVLDLQNGPRVVGLTSLGVDHTNWHGDAQQYFHDKLRVLELNGVEVVCVNSDSSTLVEQLNSIEVSPELVYSSRCDVGAIGADGTRLRGTHNRSNMALALAIVGQLTGESGDYLEDEKVMAAICDFAGLDHRYQTVGKAGGVEFINDSLSTNVLPTIAALEALPGENVALILGGYDRGVDQSELVDVLLSRPNTFVAAIPDTGWLLADRMEQKISDGFSVASHNSIRRFNDLAGATTGGFEWVSKKGNGGFVLLSPAAASFNAFSNYAERGDAFASLVQDLVTRISAES